jgi:exodeoxyribonuclease V beta subunit
MRILDLADSLVLTHSLVVSASAGSGKTYTLTVLVTADLGREAIRPFEILATTFSEAAAADLRERLLRPLDLLASLNDATWRDLLSLFEQANTADIEAFLKGLPLAERLGKSAGEVAQAAAHWRGVAWAESPGKARTFWRRTRREAELLQVSTIHSLAMRILSRGDGAADTILDVAHPALLRLLRQTVREALTLSEGDPDLVPSKILLAWAERNWADLSRGYDNHRDALGHLDPEDPAPHRASLMAALAQAEQTLAPYAANPTVAQDPTSAQRRHFKPSAILRLPASGADLAARLRWAEGQSWRAEATKSYFTLEFREALATLQPVADALEAWMRCLLVEALRRFEIRKTGLAMATFGDLVRKALASLQGGGLEGPVPKLLLVDEYQDTSRSQDAFLAALGAERIVRVGDVKQAIYGFRGGIPTCCASIWWPLATRPSGFQPISGPPPRSWPWPTAMWRRSGPSSPRTRATWMASRSPWVPRPFRSDSCGPRRRPPGRISRPWPTGSPGSPGKQAGPRPLGNPRSRATVAGCCC